MQAYLLFFSLEYDNHLYINDYTLNMHGLIFETSIHGRINQVDYNLKKRNEN